MSSRIEQQAARDYIDNYNEACLAKGETQEDVIRAFVIDKEHIDEIFAAAEEDQIECTGIRVYLSKKTPFDNQNNHPKFSAKDDYNLILVGVDAEGENINSTDAIYDHLNAAAGTSATPSEIDF